MVFSERFWDDILNAFLSKGSMVKIEIAKIIKGYFFCTSDQEVKDFYSVNPQVIRNLN